MDKKKKSGILLIAIGIFIPLTVLPFVSGWSDDKSLFQNFYNIGIQIREQKSEAPTSKPSNIYNAKKGKLMYSDVLPSKIPFRFVLVITVILIYIGILKIDSSRRVPK